MRIDLQHTSGDEPLQRVARFLTERLAALRRIDAAQPDPDATPVLIEHVDRVAVKDRMQSGAECHARAGRHQNEKSKNASLHAPRLRVERKRRSSLLGVAFARRALSRTSGSDSIR